MRTLAICSMVLAGAMVVGCDTKTDNKPTPATPAIPGAPSTPSHGNATPESVGHDAAEKAASLSDTAVKEAQEKVTQVVQYIKENKLDLAEKALNELEKIKDSLPESIRSQLANARSMLDAAKSGKGLTLPGAH